MRNLLGVVIAFLLTASSAVNGQGGQQGSTSTQEKQTSGSQSDGVASALERLEQRIEELERTQRELENAKREMEQAKAAYENATQSIEQDRKQIEQRVEDLETAKSTSDDSSQSFSNEKNIEQRVEELEAAQTAQEDATRAIIKESVSSLGSNINEFVTFSGSLEVLGGWGEDFSGASESVLTLNTADLDFEVRASDWATGRLIIEYDAAQNLLFPTNSGFDSAIDRFNINTATITVGNPQIFPPFLTAGRMFVPFGVSTGDPVADVLTIEDPLTIEVFETKEDAVGIGIGFPTPKVAPPLPPINVPTVRPQLINPLFKSLAKDLGYNPPPRRPTAPATYSPPPTPPMFNAGVYFYDGNTFSVTDRGWQPGDHINGTMGFRTKGHCGRRYDELGAKRGICPWSLDVDVDYNSSVFDSLFLESEYRSFLDQIGFVPGMAASVKATLGAVSLVGEWNGAIKDATFVDDSGRLRRINPSAWQVSLGYQFDWNPWVDKIGDQGTYVALSYSESSDLAGAQESILGETMRAGFVPKRRFLLNFGEWILDEVKFSVEYSHVVDYDRNEGGTGRSANGVFSTITYVW